MVGATGIEPVTPAMSRQCSTAELRAHRRKVRSSTSRPLIGKYRGLARMTGSSVTRPAPRAMRLVWSFYRSARSRRLGLPPAGAPDRAGRGCLSPQRIASIPPPSWPRPPCRWRHCAAPRMPSSTSCSPPPPLSACPCWPPAFPGPTSTPTASPMTRSRHVRGPPAAPAQSPDHPRRRRPRHDPERGGERRGDLSRPRAV